MGNGYGRLSRCFSSGDPTRRRRRHVSSAVTSEPYDDSLGHSFAYVRPDAGGVGGAGGCRLPSSATVVAASSKVQHSEETTTFRAISGAAVSANASTPLSTSLLLVDVSSCGGPNAAFESTTSFSSVPLQPVQRLASGTFSGPLAGAGDRGFMSGPIERGFMSGPLDNRAALFSGPLDNHDALFSGPLEKPPPSFSTQLRRSLSHGLPRSRRASAAAASFLRGITKSIARTISGSNGSAKGLKSSAASVDCGSNPNYLSNSSGRNSVEGLACQWPELLEHPNGGSLQWAQGKAGEDRVHVVVSEEHGWVFVGIYDGFNGPDATDFLLSNLYLAVHRELKGLLWEEAEEKDEAFREPLDDPATPAAGDEWNPTFATDWTPPNGCCGDGRQSSNKKRNVRGAAAKKLGENQRKLKSEWEKDRMELDRRLKEQLSRASSEDGGGTVNHSKVLKALSRALRKTEETFLDIADKIVSENPELALMGSCVLVMLMKGEDVYLMNVGDSRAVLAQKTEPDVWASMVKPKQDLERIHETSATDLGVSDGAMDGLLNLNSAAVQLTSDHSTAVEEEVRRIRNEHPDDASVMVNDRVKGSLKLTRAFGAGFLKQPKWNDALLEMFRIDYVGTSPYMTCNPFVYHHRLGPNDKFLILSSDGLYQYFTNQEAVAQVEMFIATTPEGDPAQHLVEEVLFRAAKKAGMDFHELLEIPHGDRRRYHDDISIIIISLEGQIWRSCV